MGCCYSQGASSKLALSARERVKRVLRCERAERDPAVWDAGTLEPWAGAAGGRESRSSRIASILESLPPGSGLQGWSQATDGNRVTENPVLPDFQTRRVRMNWEEVPQGERENVSIAGLEWSAEPPRAGLLGLRGLVSAGIALLLASPLR